MEEVEVVVVVVGAGEESDGTSVEDGAVDELVEVVAEVEGHTARHSKEEYRE
jgi:hypothetical protein